MSGVISALRRGCAPRRRQRHRRASGGCWPRRVRRQDCPDVAAEYLCELFDGSATALNLMDYSQRRGYHTIRQRRLASYPPKRAVRWRSTTRSATSRSLRNSSSAGRRTDRRSVDDALSARSTGRLLGAMRRTDCMGAPIRHHGRAVGELWVSRDSGRAFTRVRRGSRGRLRRHARAVLPAGVRWAS